MKKVPHLDLEVGEVSADVLVCGDPDRATRMAEKLENAVLLGNRREYRTYRGEAGGRLVTVCSHGIGAPGAAIAFEELIVAGAQRIVRVGTCGGLQPEIGPGSLVVASAAVQKTGYGYLSAPGGYPAVADCQLTQALCRVLQGDGRPFYHGIVLTTDNFYAGVSHSQPDYQLMSQANVLAVEMECAALFLVGSLRGAQTAAILAADGNVLQGGESIEGYDPHRIEVTKAIDTAVEVALQALLQW